MIHRLITMMWSGPPSSLGMSSMLLFPFWRLDAKGGELASRLRGICKGICAFYSHLLAYELCFRRLCVVVRLVLS
jgi:hypothetical protein